MSELYTLNIKHSKYILLTCALSSEVKEDMWEVILMALGSLRSLC